MAVISLDGSTLEVADEQANDQAFGRPGAGRGRSVSPSAMDDVTRTSSNAK